MRSFEVCWAIVTVSLMIEVAPSRAQNVQLPKTGEALFSARCAGCHGLDGKGGEHAPDIATSRSMQQLSDENLLRIVRDGKPAAGMPSFGSAFDEHQIKSVVEYLRSLQGKQTARELRGDSRKGSQLFFGKARCSECHMLDGSGGFIASDLSHYGQTHSPQQVRDAIVNPGKDSSANRGTAVNVMADGKSYRGLVRNEDNFSVQLQTLDGTFHFFKRSTITRIDREVQPLMPNSYGTSLSTTEIDDLVKYICGPPNRK